MSRMTSKGQVTIPKNIRQVLGVKPGDFVEFELLPDQRVLVKPVLTTAVFERYVGYLADRAGEDPVSAGRSCRWQDPTHYFAQAVARSARCIRGGAGLRCRPSRHVVFHRLRACSHSRLPRYLFREHYYRYGAET